MSKRYYPGFCDQYGMLRVQAAAVIAPAIVMGTGAWLMAGSPLSAAIFGALSGSYGYAMGAMAHIVANHRAATRKMDSASGKRLVRIWQAAAYGTTTALMTGAFMAPASSPDAPQDNSPDANNVTAPSAAATYYRAPQHAPLITSLKPPRL